MTSSHDLEINQLVPVLKIRQDKPPASVRNCILGFCARSRGKIATMAASVVGKGEKNISKWREQRDDVIKNVEIYHASLCSSRSYENRSVCSWKIERRRANERIYSQSARSFPTERKRERIATEKISRVSLGIIHYSDERRKSGSGVLFVQKIGLALYRGVLPSASVGRIVN